MKTPHELYQHLTHQFQQYSVPELIHLNNDLIHNSSWGTNKSAFRTAVLNALAKKGIDLSPIVSRDDGFTSVQLVAIALDDNNMLIPAPKQ